VFFAEERGGFAMNLRLRASWILSIFAMLGSVQAVQGQGLIIDRRPHIPIAHSYEVREVGINARVRDQVAEVQVSQTFYNPGSFVIEAEYLFPMPEDGAIQNFVLMVDGKEMPGRLLPKDEARRIFEDIVRTKRDPALLEYMGRGAFRTSVFPIPPGAERRVTLRYNQICRREKDVVELSYPFGTQKFTSKPIHHLTLRASIDSRDAIKSIYCPSHEVTIERSGDHSAVVKLDQRETLPTNDFRLVYTLAEGAVGASVLSYRPSEGDDGYFLVLASPQVKPPDTKPLPKTVIFVLDRSGSMTGKKIEQAKNALKFVLDNLREDDTFNIVAYDDRVESFKPELQRYSRESQEQARRFIDNIQPGGSTNIDEALKTSLGMIKEESRPSYVLFLTDGLPTAGEMRETAIADHGRSANRYHSRVFVFGVGYDVNARLLDRVSGGNGGTSEYVKPDEDIEAHVSRFYSKLTRPALTALAIEMSNTDVNRTYPRDLPDLFEGGQLVWVGRYRQSGKTTVRLSGKVAGDRQSYDFPAELAGTDRGSSYDFVEKLWAVRRVGFIIDQIDLHGQNKELTDELVALSTKYGILTPYTSFLADERVPLHTLGVNARRAGESLLSLSEVGGQAGVEQRAAKQVYQQADRLADLSTANASRPAARGGGAAGLPAGGMMSSMGGAGGGFAGMAKRKASAAAGSYAFMQDKEGHDGVALTVRHVGKKTFFFKDGRWVDSTVKAEDDAKATVIEQFSDAYFGLARKQSAEVNQYLTFDEPVTVNLDGMVYKIERPKK
jgi:Ca-activated chloride channel family protein